jgi:hypothetical protein
VEHGKAVYDLTATFPDWHHHQAKTHFVIFKFEDEKKESFSQIVRFVT